MAIAEGEGPRDERLLPRDLWHRAVTIGEAMGADRESLRVLGLGLIIVATLVGVVVAENIISILHGSTTINFFEPFLREGSSWLTFVLFAWIPWLAIRHVSLTSQGRWGTAGTHIAALLAFSVCHVGGFVALRTLIYGIAGWPYRFPLSEFLYEFRKEIFGYFLTTAVFWFVASFAKNENPKATSERAVFDIRDGAQLLRVAHDDILAISSAGNYAEFSLRDGRKALMRTSLSALNQELESHGFVRTHRSWIVNSRALMGLKPVGSGDYEVDLGAVSAPLSRRYAQALAILRRA